MTIAAMKQALEALDSDNPDIQLRAATALRAAIEQAEKPQRVCSGCDKTNTNDSMWAVYCVDCWEKTEALEEVNLVTWDASAPLVVTPHPIFKKSWIGLTEEEVHQAFCHVEYETPNDWNADPERWCQQFARYLEQRLKEKNHA